MFHKHFLLPLILRQGFWLIMYKRKGVRIVSLSYPTFRSWRTLPMDKTTAPHRLDIYSSPSGSSIATMQVLLPDYLHGNNKPPSLKVEDKISITPFPAGMARHRKNSVTAGCRRSPASFPTVNIAFRRETLNMFDKNIVCYRKNHTTLRAKTLYATGNSIVCHRQ